MKSKQCFRINNWNNWQYKNNKYNMNSSPCMVSITVWQLSMNGQFDFDIKATGSYWFYCPSILPTLYIYCSAADTVLRQHTVLSYHHKQCRCFMRQFVSSFICMFNRPWPLAFWPLVKNIILHRSLLFTFNVVFPSKWMHLLS